MKDICGATGKPCIRCQPGACSSRRAKHGTITIDGDSVLLTCAVRYALGRQTYMPCLVVNETIPLLDGLSDRNLHVMERDLWEYSNNGYFSEREWQSLWEAVTTEREKRKG